MRSKPPSYLDREAPNHLCRVQGEVWVIANFVVVAVAVIVKVASVLLGKLADV
jgi:hypothetical protein